MENSLIVIIIVIIIIVIFAAAIFTYFTVFKQKGSFNINNVQYPLPYDSYHKEVDKFLKSLDLIQNEVRSINMQLVNAINLNQFNREQLRHAIETVLIADFGEGDFINNVTNEINMLYNNIIARRYTTDLDKLKTKWNDYCNKISILPDTLRPNTAQGTISQLTIKCTNILTCIDVIADLINRSNHRFIDDVHGKIDDYLLEKTFKHYYPDRYTN